MEKRLQESILGSGMELIVGIGTDIVEMHRVKGAVRRLGHRFASRILSRTEQLAYDTYSEARQIEFLAGRFAAKEAIAKAAGCGLGKLGMQRVSIHLAASAADAVGNADAAKTRGLCVTWEDAYAVPPWPQDARWHVSISHSTSAAIAMAILEEGAR